MKIPIVNKKDEIICYKERDSEESSDIYRVSALWLTNSKGEVLLSRRAFTKSHSPGMWITAVAGTVEEGETYDQNIIKEIKEELGLDLEIKKNVKVLKNSKDRPHNFFCQWYTATTDISDKDIVFDKKEVAEVKWFSKEELIRKVKENPNEFSGTVHSWVNGEIDFDNELIKTKSFELAIYKKGNENAEKLALVIPGRLDTKDYAHMKSHVDFLAKKGYLAVSFDPPGVWESKGDISEYTTTNYIKSINELIEYFGNKETILVGHSRGGATALFTAIQNDKITKIVAIMASTTVAPMSKEDEKRGFRISSRDDPKGGKKTFNLPKEYFSDAQKYDLLNEISKCTIPKLFIFGEKDNMVKPKMVKELFEAAQEPKQIASINAEHDYRKDPKMVKQVEEILEEFLEE